MYHSGFCLLFLTENTYMYFNIKRVYSYKGQNGGREGLLCNMPYPYSGFKYKNLVFLLKYLYNKITE